MTMTQPDLDAAAGGLGFELAFLFPLLLWMLRIRFKSTEIGLV